MMSSLTSQVFVASIRSQVLRSQTQMKLAQMYQSRFTDSKRRLHSPLQMEAFRSATYPQAAITTSPSIAPRSTYSQRNRISRIFRRTQMQRSFERLVNTVLVDMSISADRHMQMNRSGLLVDKSQ